jgi:hypothetical protein
MTLLPRIIDDVAHAVTVAEQARLQRIHRPGSNGPNPFCHTVIVGNAFDDSIIVPPFFVADETNITSLSFVTMGGTCSFDIYIGEFFADYLQTESVSTAFDSAVAEPHDPIPAGTPIYVSPWGTSPDCSGLSVGFMFDRAA